MDERKDGQTDRGKTVYPLPLRGAGVQTEFEDIKGVIRICNSKKNIQHNGQKKMDKRTNNDLQNFKHQIKDRVTRIPLNIRGVGGGGVGHLPILKS